MTARRIRVFAGAGEASGDRILAALLRGIRAARGAAGEEIDLAGFGGPLCEREGLSSAVPLADLAVNGVWDVLRRAFFLMRAYARLRRALDAFHPDLVILVDYPGMNVGLARRARRRGIPVHYIAPPQLWAYRDDRPGEDRPGAATSGRLRRLRAALEAGPGPATSLQFLFPFEAGSYAPWSGPTHQGHFFGEPAFEPARGVRLLLCPGSRRAVLARNLPVWLDRVRDFFGTLEGVDVLVPEFLADEARRICREANPAVAESSSGIEILVNKDLAFERAGAAIAFPGTITLELFLRRIPVRAWAVVDPVTLWLGRRRLRGPYLCLPNVLGGRAGAGSVLPEWVGCKTDFKSNPPVLPESIREWGAEGGDTTLVRVWAAMGSEQGAETGVRACEALLAKV